MASGRDPLAGVEWETDQDLRNRDPRIRLRLTRKALDNLAHDDGPPLLFEVAIPVTDGDNGGVYDETVVIEISRAE